MVLASFGSATEVLDAQLIISTQGRMIARNSSEPPFIYIDYSFATPVGISDTFVPSLNNNLNVTSLGHVVNVVNVPAQSSEAKPLLIVTVRHMDYDNIVRELPLNIFLASEPNLTRASFNSDQIYF